MDVPEHVWNSTWSLKLECQSLYLEYTDHSAKGIFTQAISQQARLTAKCTDSVWLIDAQIVQFCSRKSIQDIALISAVKDLAWDLPQTGPVFVTKESPGTDSLRRMWDGLSALQYACWAV